MLDLSNHNGPVDFRRVQQSGQRLVYLKCSEGTSYTDPLFAGYRSHAQAAGLMTGAYHFARPHRNSAAAEAKHFLALLPKLGAKDLRPCLDFEDGAPSSRFAAWAAEWMGHVLDGCGVAPLLYSYASYLSVCRFPAALCPLWIASYGRNDAIEHSYTIPSPWRKVAAHQYASSARVAGCSGQVDISHVFDEIALRQPPKPKPPVHKPKPPKPLPHQLPMSWWLLRLKQMFGR